MSIPEPNCHAEQAELPIEFGYQRAPGDIERLGPAVVRRERRPTEREPLVCEEAVRAVMPSLLRYLGSEAGEPSRLFEELSTVVHCEDGYQAAGYLERKFFWSSDSELVDLLDSLPSRLNDAKYRLVAVWISEFGLKSPLEVGEEVSIRARVEGKMQDVSGFVTKVNTVYGQCTVRCPSLGHVVDGLGTHGFILDWERVSSRSMHAVAA